MSTIQVTPDEILRTPQHAQLLAITTWCICVGTKYISRRTLIDVLADIFRDADHDYIDADGGPYTIPDLDTVFEPEAFEDRLDQQHYFEWSGRFMKWAIEPPKRNANASSIEKLRMIDLAMRAGGPALWRNLKKR